MLDFKDLRCFVSVYELGGFVRAALALHTVQSNISHRISRLERAIGAQLFERRHRSIVPTQKGELLYKHAIRVLSEIDEMEIAIKARRAA